MDTLDVSFRDLAVEDFDTPTLLQHAGEQAVKRRYEDFCIVDVDSHHYETRVLPEILEYIEDPVMRHQARFQGMRPTAASPRRAAPTRRWPAASRATTARRSEKTPSATPHRDITLTRRWMDAMGVDITCLFPTPMLALGLTPRVEVEVALARAYNRWLIEDVPGARAAHQVDALSALQRSRGDCYKWSRISATSRASSASASPRRATRACTTTPTRKTYARARGARPAACLPRRLHVGRRPDDGAVQPLHRRPRAGLHLVQHGASDQLDRATACPSAFPSSR